MKKQLTENEIDNLMRSLVCDAGADEETVKGIADSPTLWWGVQRQIAVKQETRSPWPPANIVRRWLMIALPTGAAAALVLAFFVMRPVDRVTGPAIVENPSAVEAPTGPIAPVVPGANVPDEVRTVSAVHKTRRALLPAAARKTRSDSSNLKETGEIKSEFIALSYAQNPESGQIVRVKVPSSMMVSLGLVSQVQRPTSLVNAEVIVGDDGTTHAIRFIR